MSEPQLPIMRSAFDQTGLPDRAGTGQERMVARNGAAVQVGVTTTTCLADGIMRCDGLLARRVRTTILETAQALYAEEETIANPRVRALARVVNDRVVEEHARHQLGFYRQAGLQMAELLSQDITPPSVVELTGVAAAAGRVPWLIPAATASGSAIRTFACTRTRKWRGSYRRLPGASGACRWSSGATR